MSVMCLECGGDAEIVGGEVIYPHRPDLSDKNFYRCACGAYVGCHDGTLNPLGFPCNAATRRARQAAHAAFDPLWEGKIRRDGCSKSVARKAAYKWLAGQLGIAPKDAHIFHMNAEMAARVVAVCNGVGS